MQMVHESAGAIVDTVEIGSPIIGLMVNFVVGAVTTTTVERHAAYCAEVRHDVRG